MLWIHRYDTESERYGEIKVQKLLAMGLLISIVAGTSGCGTVAKRAFKEVKGASSKAQPVPGTSVSRYSRYQGVSISNPRTDLGGLVDRKFTSALGTALRKELTTDKDAPFRGGSPTLTIEPEVAWYSEAGGLGGMLGSDSYAVVLFWLSEDGSPLGKVQIVTKSAASRTGEDDMANSMAKKLAGFFSKQRKKK